MRLSIDSPAACTLAKTSLAYSCVFLMLLGSCVRADELSFADAVVTLSATPELTESSGLAFSIRDPNCVWTHNDSGDRARLFSFDSRTGKPTGRCELLSAPAVDWESMTTGDPDRGELIVADCGDNLARREFITLHRFPEPDPSKNTRLDPSQYDTLRVQFEGGPVDCESIWYDVERAGLVLLAKGRLPIAGVYFVPDDSWNGDATTSTPAAPITARRIATIGLPMATGADRDLASGNVWIASYLQAFCFRRGEHANLAEQMKQIPVAFDMPRLRQIEGIAIDANGRVWVTSEGSPATLAVSYFLKTDPAPVRQVR